MDDINYLNLGFYVKKVVQSFSIAETHPSAWNSYPEHYKFMGLQVNVKDVRTITTRETYALLEFSGDIGGTFEFLFVLGFLLTKGFISFNFHALIANRMYIWKSPFVSETRQHNRAQPLPRRSASEPETPLKTPLCLEIYTAISCCLQRTKWARYEESLRKV
jgi:hypothetical protein